MRMVFEIVRRGKGIPPSRIRVRIVDRTVEGPKLEWTMKRLGVFEGTELDFTPSTPRCWLWHEYAWYERTYCTELLRALGAHASAHRARPAMPLAELITAATKSPALRSSTLVFLRQFPDLFLVEGHETSGLFEVRRNGTDERGKPMEPAGPIFIADEQTASRIATVGIY